MDFDVRVLPEWTSFFLQLLATLVLFLVLRHFLFKPALDMLNKRREKIENDINKAKEGKEEALALKEEYELKIDEAKKEGRDIIEAARKRGEELRENIIAEARSEAESIKEKAAKEIEGQRQKAMDDFKSEIVAISMMVASKVIEKNLDEQVHRNMINEFIDEVGESKWQS